MDASDIEHSMKDRKPARSYLKRPDYLAIARWIGYTILGIAVFSVLLVLLFRWVDPPTTSFMLQKKFERSESADLAYQWADWDEISNYVKIAAVASEDQRFPWHSGFDFEAIGQALEERRKGDRLRGASTITQQVGKNLFLWPGRSFIRKGLEAYFTVLIELLWPKKRILEMYLNIAQFGKNVFGVEAAAQAYFGTTAKELNMIQSALLVTALPSPDRYNVNNPSPYLIERRNWVLRQMFHLGNTAYLEPIK